MLVLTRKTNQQIRLGNDITVTILRVKGNSIRIGIEAPRDVRVVRGELDQLDGNEDAAQSRQGLDDVGGSGITMEVELENVDLESLAAPSTESLEQSPTARVYQMRTSAPLARFLPTAVRDGVSAYSI